MATSRQSYHLFKLHQHLQILYVCVLGGRRGVEESVSILEDHLIRLVSTAFVNQHILYKVNTYQE